MRRPPPDPVTGGGSAIRDPHLVDDTVSNAFVLTGHDISEPTLPGGAGGGVFLGGDREEERAEDRIR